jgi:hypothetical protein
MRRTGDSTAAHLGSMLRQLTNELTAIRSSLWRDVRSSAQPLVVASWHPMVARITFGCFKLGFSQPPLETFKFLDLFTLSNLLNRESYADNAGRGPKKVFLVEAE